MRILLDCRPLQLAGPDDERSRLIFAAAKALSASGGVEWLMVADQRFRQGLFPALPGKVVIRRGLPGRVGWQLWYDRLARVAKQGGVDRVWLTAGIASGDMDVPICLWMPERADPSEGDGRRGYTSLYHSRLKRSLKVATAIVCYSERDRSWLGGIGPDEKEKIRVLRAVADESIGVITEDEKEKIKSERQGKEYFLADLTGCGEEDAVNLLKAFSLFKKRQQSGMLLVLAGRMETFEGVVERLKSYRYRQDVSWSGWAPAGAAYAVLLPVEGAGLGTTLLNTWRSGVPVIAAGGGLLEEMAQGAMLGVAPGDPASLAAQLMRIYKEEDLRQELVCKGFERLKVYSRENFLQVLRVITEIAAC
jgi:glycosyltransferase involved in cell wall biosynthesis